MPDPNAQVQSKLSDTLMRWHRLIIILLLIVVLAFGSFVWAGRAAGTALAFGVIWFFVGIYRPLWLKGKSGHVLFAIVLLLILTTAF